MDRTDDKRRTIFICALLGAVTLASFWPVLRHEFVNVDDPDYVTENPYVLRGLTWQSAAWAFQTAHVANWHPLTWLSHMLDVQLFGLQAVGHHLTSVLLHIANTLLLFLALRRMTGARWRSVLVAALFAVHPLHVESVAWISERKDVLSGFFFMLTVWAYAHYAEVQRPKSKVQSRESNVQTQEPAPGPTPHASRFAFHVSRFYFLSVLFFACGLMSKAMLVTLPFVLLLLDYWPLRRFEVQSPGSKAESQGSVVRGPWSRFTLVPLLVEKAPFLLLAGASSIVTFTTQQSAGAVRSLEAFSPGFRMANALLSYVRYIGKMIWPARLAAFYPAPNEWPRAWVFGAVLLLAALTAFCLWRVKRAPYLVVGWFWYLGTLVPVIGIVQVGMQSMADRYTYLPLIGLFIAVVWSAAEIAARWPATGIWLALGAAAGLAACGALTWAQAGVWRTTSSLFAHAVAVTRDNEVAQNDLGACLLKGGNVAAAEPHFAEAVRIRPKYQDALVNLALCRYAQGRVPEAIGYFERALDILPTPACHFDVANVLKEQGRLKEAEAHYQAALRLRPYFVEAWLNLGAVKGQQGDVEAAAQAYGTAVQLRPDYASAHLNLGQALLVQHKWDEAIAHLRTGLSVAPQNAEAHFSLGAALASKGQYAEAAVEFAECCRLRPEYIQARESLGEALFYQGKLPEAVSELRRVLQARPSAMNHYYLALSLHAEGQFDEALPHYREAVRLDPNTPSYLNDLAWILATHTKAEVRDASQAVRLAEAACRLSGGKEGRFWGTLDAAYAEAGRFDEAVETAKKARDLATASGQTAIAKAAEERLKLYERKTPYRQQ